jgi:hypothetical protein
MSTNTVSRNLLGLLFLLFLAFSNIEIAAQCDGTYFKRFSTTLIPVNTYFFRTADANGDGIPDLLGHKLEDQPGVFRDKFYILPGNGNGGFGTPIIIDLGTGFNVFDFAVGDIDNDGDKDIWMHFYSPSPGGHRVFRNNGDGTYTALPSTHNAIGLAWYMIDINSDGKDDLIIGLNSSVVYHLSNGDGTFQDAVSLATNTVGGSGVYHGDFNSDGKPDFNLGANLYINQGNAVFSTVSNAIPLGANETVRDARDYTGDGKPDIVTLTTTANSKLSLFVNLGSNSFQRTDFPFSIDQQPFDPDGIMFFGNFSGNAGSDVIFSSPLYNKTVVLTNDGAGNFSQQTFNYKLRSFSLAADFDSDGKTDLVTLSNGFGYNARPKLFFEASIFILKNVCRRVGQTKLVDFDHSGATDFSFWTPADGKWSYLSSTNPTPPGVSINWGAGSFGDIPAPGDFDGDGTTDRAVYRDSTGVWWILRSSDGQPSAVQFGLPGDKPVVGDYDGDGISDLAVWRPSDGNWYILFLGTQSYTIVHWGQDGDKPVPEDYDGDGKTDLAVFRTSTGDWYYLKSSDLNLGTVHFGLGTDKPVPADYDGDGKADISVYRESSRVFHILRSYDLSYSAFNYGSPGDIFQPGDYDGDFVAEPAVYRPSNQSWRVFFQPNQVTFGASNVVPTASMLRIE